MQEQPFEQDKMTLTYALIADGGIVLAADSQVTHTHRVPTMEGPRIVGTYEGKKSKIRRLGNHCAFSMSGNAGLANTLLARAELAGIDSSESFWKLFPSGNCIAKETMDKYNCSVHPVGQRQKANGLIRAGNRGLAMAEEVYVEGHSRSITRVALATLVTGVNRHSSQLSTELRLLPPGARAAC